MWFILVSSTFSYSRKNYLLFFSVPMKICWKHVFFETMQSHSGFICSRRLFLTFGNLTVIKYKKLSYLSICGLEFGYFGVEFQKSDFVFVISILEFVNMQSFMQKQETFKLESKNTLFRYFRAIKTSTKFLIGSLEFVKT